MLSRPRVQVLWLQLLQKGFRPGDIAVEKVEDGYFIVVMARAERVFEQGMQEFENFLQVSPEEWLPGSPAGGCGRDLNKN